jgi:hypothetical protein
MGVTPRYEQKQFDQSKQNNQFQTVVAPKDNVVEDALWIHQDAYISLGNFDTSQTVEFKLKNEAHGIYVFVLEGEIAIGNQTLATKDALGIWETENVEIHINEDAKILVVEVPMN